MIPIEALSQVTRVTRIIVHADCPDGTASAMVLHDVLPSAVIVAIQYGQAREALEELLNAFSQAAPEVGISTLPALRCLLPMKE